MNIYEITTQEFYLSDFGNAAFHSFVKSIFFGTIKIEYFIKERTIDKKQIVRCSAIKNRIYVVVFKKQVTLKYFKPLITR